MALSISRSRFNVLCVSFAFMVLFSAYNTLQNYATSLFPGSLGNQSLSVLYGSVAVTVFWAPPLVDALGSRGTMLLGGACYVAYMISLVHIIPSIVLTMSFVIGFGAAILWVALGVFLAQNSTTSTYGGNTGLFWSIFQLCAVIGNLCTYLVFSKLSSTSTLYVGFAVTGGVGVALLLLLRPPDEHAALQVAPPSLSLTQRVHSAMKGVARALSLLLTRDTALLTPMYFFSGLELSFWTGEFPQLLGDPAVIGLVLTFAGVGEVLGGVLSGRVSDSCGRSLSMALGATAYATGLGLATWMKFASPGPDPMLAGAPLIAYIAALLFGIGDSAFNTNTYAIVAQLYDEAAGAAGAGGTDIQSTPLLTRVNEEGDLAPPSTAHADAVEAKTHSVGGFTIFQLVQNIGSAVGFYYALPFPMHGAGGTLTQVYVQVALLSLALVTFVTVDRLHAGATHRAPKHV